jgi:hypothetical protein
LSTSLRPIMHPKHERYVESTDNIICAVVHPALTCRA